MADQSLTTGLRTQRGEWFRSVAPPVVVVCALAGLASGLYIFLGTQPFVYRIPPSVEGTGTEEGLKGGRAWREGKGGGEGGRTKYIGGERLYGVCQPDKKGIKIHFFL